MVHEIVHVTETQERIDNEMNEIKGKNLLVDYHETKAINGHSNGGGSNGHDSNGSAGGNGGAIAERAA